MMLNNGCLCCTVRDDLVDMLNQLVRASDAVCGHRAPLLLLLLCVWTRAGPVMHINLCRAAPFIPVSKCMGALPSIPLIPVRAARPV